MIATENNATIFGIQYGGFLFYSNNVKATECIVNAAIKYKVKNFIFASSVAVYGKATFFTC